MAVKNCENCCYFAETDNPKWNNKEHCCFREWGHEDWELAPCDDLIHEEILEDDCYSRMLSEEEKDKYIKNREELHEQLTFLRTDFEEMNDEDLLNCRETLLKRVNICLELILEMYEYNL